MTTLYAQPYDISASGFYFETPEEYDKKAAVAKNDYCQPVEEFEIQFIDGELIDCQLAQAVGLHQGTIAAFFELCEELDEHDKCILIVAIGECGYNYEPETTSPRDFEVDIYEMGSLRELAEYFVDEGIMGEIPENLLTYFDYDALARDLAVDYSEITIAGTRYVYACR